MLIRNTLLILLMNLSVQLLAQNTMNSPYDVGSKSSSFNFSSTLNTASYTNNFAGRSTNDVFYKLVITTTMLIEISHCNSQVSDTYLHLLNASGTVLYYNDDYIGENKCTNTWHSYLKVILSAGTYYVVSEGFSQNGNITTTIKGQPYTPLIGDTFENPINLGTFSNQFNVSDTRNTSSYNNQYRGREGNDVYYKFALSSKMTIEISHCGSQVSDTYLSILNSTGALLYYNDDYSDESKCPNTLNSYLKLELSPGTYYVVSEGYSSNGNITTNVKSLSTEIVSYDQNFILEKTTYGTNLTVSNITYYDGLGRPIQEVAIGQSPNKNDIVRPIVYDAFGREDKQYLPYERTGTSGTYTSTAITEQKNYHTSLYGSVDGAKAYSQTTFDGSPLNRITAVNAPGNDWSSKPSKVNYLANTTNDAVKLWYTSSEKLGSGSLKQTTNYAANQLYVTENTDEDGTMVREFKDKSDRVIETHQVAGTTIYRTSYVYDDIGRLRYIIPPKAQGLATTHVDFEKLIYQYEFDARGRCIAKRLPDSETILMVYDSRDRSVFTQDGNLKAQGKWRAIVYDALNRPIAEGLITTTISHDNFLSYCSGTYKNQTRSSASYTLASLHSSIPALTDANVLLYNYYDDYSGMPTSMVFEKLDFDIVAKLDPCKGQLTGTKVKVLDGNEFTSSAKWLNTAYYYDNKYQVIQLKQEDYFGTSTNAKTIRTQYSFDGLPLRVQEKQMVSSTTLDLYYEYDHARRLVKTSQQINSGTNQTLATISYDGTGRMKSKTLGNNEQVTYAYNIRDWLTGINSSNIDNNNSKFAMRLYYNDAPNGKRYNGNIAQIDWKHNGESKQSYTYAYDGFNRLTQGVHGGGYNEKAITYDANGNILTLTREKGSDAGIYQYTTYSGNQLKTLMKGSTSYTYEYDKNGNTTKDGLRGITIDYNLLNLPKKVVKGTGSLEYVYDALGNRLAKKLNGNFTQFYAGSLVYNGDKTVAYAIHPEGLAPKVGTSFTYQYNITDHLGNVRTVLDPSKTVVQKTDYYPFGLTHVVSNLNKNKYLFGGKEIQDELSLNTYDFHARQQDPITGRFTSIDPMAEKYYGFSTYNYCANNPVRLIDPTGMDWKDVLKETYEEFSKVLSQALKDVGLSPAQLKSEDPKVRADASKKRENFKEGLNTVNETMLSIVPGAIVAYKAATDQEITKGDVAIEALAAVPFGKIVGATKGAYGMTSIAVRSALADRIGKRGYTEVGYQFQKHFGRGGNWGGVIPQSVRLNPTTFNEAGYKSFKEIWRAPGTFQKVGGFLEKRLPDGRGIRLQENWKFKGFLD